MITIFSASLYGLIFIYGLITGSFLNVLIYRIPRREPFIFGRSHCPNCATPLQPRELVPLLSYVLLKGKCRSCNATISPRYAGVELLTGVLFIWTIAVMGISLLSALACLFSALLIVISFIDWDTMTIPDGLVVAILVVAVPFFFLQPDISFGERVLGFFIVSLPMFGVASIIGGAFGGGDIKLIAVCGLILGAKNVVLATFIAILLGGSYACYLLLSKQAKSGAQMPFGPFLCGGCFLSMLYGTQVVSWYLGQF